MRIYDKNLWEYLKERSTPTYDLLPIAERFNIFSNIFSAVMHIQSSGQLHLDLKPSNILLNVDDTGKWNQRDLVVTDFGIGGSTAMLTDGKRHKIRGTPGFASPEQLLGIPHRKGGGIIASTLFTLLTLVTDMIRGCKLEHGTQRTYYFSIKNC